MQWELLERAGRTAALTNAAQGGFFCCCLFVLVLIRSPFLLLAAIILLFLYGSAPSYRLRSRFPGAAEPLLPPLPRAPLQRRGGSSAGGARACRADRRRPRLPGVTPRPPLPASRPAAAALAETPGLRDGAGRPRLRQRGPAAGAGRRPSQPGRNRPGGAGPDRTGDGRGLRVPPRRGAVRGPGGAVGLSARLRPGRGAGGGEREEAAGTGLGRFRCAHALPPASGSNKGGSWGTEAGRARAAAV